MKKTAIALTLSLITLNAFASPIKNSELRSYKVALGLAMAHQPLKCVINGDEWRSDDVFVLMDRAQSGHINSNGLQPLLILIETTYNQGLDSNTYSITTSEDGRSVDKIKFEQKSCLKTTRNVNLGNIYHPHFVSKVSTNCQITGTGSCHQ